MAREFNLIIREIFYLITCLFRFQPDDAPTVDRIVHRLSRVSQIVSRCCVMVDTCLLLFLHVQSCSACSA